MNKKLLFAAMALPMLFTACSQDELIEEVSGGIEAPKVQGYYVTLNPTLGGEMTRAQWVDANYKLTWDQTDKISVYWLNDQTTVGKNLKANFNSVFKTSDGSGFTSESLVYEGGNVAVFPGNTNVTSIQEIKLTVDNPQDASTILETPYISNLVTVSKKSQQSEQVAGYNNGLYAPMKMAANVVVFDFTLKNTADLVKNHGFKIEEVSLVTKKFFAAKNETNETTGEVTEIPAELKDVKAFTNEATLQIENGVTPKDQKEVTYKGKDSNGKDATLKLKTITQSLYAEGTPSVTSLVAKEIKTIDEAAGKYQVKFVILPTDAVDFDENSEIVIKTNCGRINLTSTETVNKVTTKVDEFTKVEEGETAPVVAGAIYNVGSKETWTITQMLKQVLKARTMEKDQKSNFEGEIVGRPYACQFTADMKDATLDKSEVYSSDDIIKYVNIHADMKSEDRKSVV